jgi:uracil-DNA glycosylase
MNNITFIDEKYEDMTLYNYTLEYLPTKWKDLFLSNLDIIKYISENIEGIVYPPRHKIYNIFYQLSPKDIKVVILGQDPYHNEGSAMGYAFSLNRDVKKINPSLLNIKKVVKDCGYNVESHGDLSNWVEQGVFLLNTALTVNKGEPESHIHLWYEFTRNILEYITTNNSKIVFLLWGTKSWNFIPYIKTNSGYILKNGHPSPLSRNSDFKTSKCFIKANEMLRKNNIKEIDWSIN